MNTRNKLGQFIKGHPSLLPKKGFYVKCANCEKLIYRTHSLIKKNFNVCSIKCRSAIIRKNFRMEKAHNWKGGKRLAKSGYIMIYVPNHPFNSYGYVREHRLVMEKHLNRFLKRHELIHHKNGILTDNRIDNLSIVTKGEHNKIHKPRKKRP